MLTIGEFATATGLTAKALRLYDDLGLLTPAEVGPGNGYRYYEPEQIEQARLVARLRSAGVPLPRITTIIGLTPEAATAELLSYWRQVEADTKSARDVVVSLAVQLRGRDIAMNETATPSRSAHRAGRGARSGQLDDLYPRKPRLTAQITGQRLFAVADGFGGVEEDAPASRAIDALEVLDGVEPGADPLGALDAAVAAGAEAVSQGKGGTTLTAILLLADRALIAHVGDSRVYRVRQGSLDRLTRDHTALQSLVDEGRLTPDEAWADPRRVQLNRAIGQGAASAPDLSVHTIERGDRFVLTTDGVHGVLEGQQFADLVVATGDPETVASAVEEAVLAAGAPDNYGLIVVDV
ncbi:MAG TPA: MerR family transcriptional regulator [Nocardioides sp.]|jgi:protein phosphatase|nr:MerR family transcriptional regulator [Nocardioides sp.]